MDVRDILTPAPHCVAPGSPAADALQLMHREDVRHLPVVEGQRLVGVVSDRDLLFALGWMPESGPGAGGPRAGATVEELMHADPEVVSPGDTVVSAAVQMSVHRIGCLPVMDGERLVGIVTEMDLLKAYVASCRDGGIEPALDVPVSQVMRQPVHSIADTTSLAEAAARSRAMRVRHLPVLRGGRLAGLVSDRDLRAAVGDGRPGDTPVAAVMATRLVTIGPDARASQAAELMLHHRFSALPVVTAEGLDGIVTLTDLLDHCTQTLHEKEPPARR